MTSAHCAHPISSADIFEYWAGELEVLDRDRVEDHIFTCPPCAAALADGEALARGVRLLVRSGQFHSLVPDTVLNRLARDGARIRTYVLNPGDVVPCAVWEDDEVIVTRLRGHFSGGDNVSVVATLGSGEELGRSEGITIQRDQYELIEAFSAERVRNLPTTTVRLRVTAMRGGTSQLLGEYTLEHTAAPAQR